MVYPTHYFVRPANGSQAAQEYMTIRGTCFVLPRPKPRQDRSGAPPQRCRNQLEVGDKVFLNLHKGYTLPSITSPKLSIQRVGPFKIVKKVGNLAYKLDIPTDWKIHPVISIAHLEPASAGEDSYDREKPTHPEPVSEFNGPEPSHASAELVKEERAHVV